MDTQHAAPRRELLPRERRPLPGEVGHGPRFLERSSGVYARRVADVPDGGHILAEGWAFSGAELMEREGFLSDRAVRLMRLNDQAWRFCRVVIDAEPHLGVMGFAAAVDFLSAVAHMDRYEAEIECRRYAVKPGQAMSHLVGRRELERRAARCSASRPASLRGFHDDVLGRGAAPPAVIAWGKDLAPAPPAASLRP